MIIYGTGSSKINITGINTTDSCPNCESKHSLQVGYFQRYAHIFWIPFFPIGKRYFSVCSNCKAAYEQNELAIPLELKKHSKTPIWTFSGLIIISLLVVFIIFDIKRDKANNDKDMMTKIENPTAGQIYEIKLEGNKYSLVKLVGTLSSDTVLFVHHQYMVDKKKSLTKLRISEFEDEKDDDNIYYWTLNEIKGMIEDGNIMKIRD